MLFGVLKMPYEMAMYSELSRLQFYQRVQQLVARVEAQPAKGLFIDLIAQHEGLAEELAQPEQEPVATINVLSEMSQRLQDENDELKAAVAAEREACAKVCEENMFFATGEHHAKAIRARGNT